MTNQNQAPRSIDFITTAPFGAAVERVVEALSAALEANKRTLWLVSGGSAAKVAAAASKELPATQQLLVMQVDERYGLPNHPDANWRHLMEAGFDASKFVCMPMLGDDDFETVVNDYDAMLEQILSESGYSLGLFGIGADGHTAGLLPNSSALKSDRLVAGFQGPDYQRITMTARAIGRLDLAVAYAVGKDKESALVQLRRNVSIDKQPAQALKGARQAVVYNDFITNERREMT